MAVVDEQTDEATKKKILGLDVLEQRQWTAREPNQDGERFW
jgi:hypothetical protein